MSRDTQSIDLDNFLIQDAERQEAQAANPTASVTMPNADRMVVVGILADDSISMDGLQQAVVQGMKLGVEAFRGARGSDFHLNVRGFRRSYFVGALSEVDDRSFDSYGVVGGTPLVRRSIDLLREVRRTAEQYRVLGIPTTVALLIMTDGEPSDEDSAAPEEFAREIQAGDYIVGMGIVSEGASKEARISRYVDIFERMGIQKRVTPSASPAEVRHAINQFSQSVATIA